MSHSLLVTGASGQFGQRVLHHLLETLHVDPARIIATTRKPEALADAAARGIAVQKADFDDAASMASAFAGVERMLLISTDALDRPGRRLEQHRAALAAAEKAGVQHVVYTSMPAADKALVLFAPDHAGTEAALAASALPGWTVLRNHWYFENLFMSLPGILANGGQWFHAASDGRTANIARDDLARAAAAVLAGQEQGKNTLTLSGEEALTVSEIAAQLTATLGRPITPVPLPAAALVQGMVGAGLPEPMAQVLASFDTNTAAGFVGTVTDDYRRITGAAPQRFGDWLSIHRAALLGG